MYVCMYVDMYVFMYIYIYMYMCIYMYISIYIYTLFKALASIPPGLKKVLPKGGVVLSFPPSSFDNSYQNLTNIAPKSIKNMTNLAQGGGKGYQKISKHMKK